MYIKGRDVITNGCGGGDWGLGYERTVWAYSAGMWEGEEVGEVGWIERK